MARRNNHPSTAVLDAETGVAAAQPLGPGTIPLTLTVNGRAFTVHVDPATTLVEVLRQTLGLTGTKVGCDRGACSACTVWVDGEVAASCMTFALDVRDRQITTIEGLADGEQLHPVQKVTGQARYTFDVQLPGMLHARRVVSTVPHARIKSIDTSEAETYPGVRAVHVLDRIMLTAQLREPKMEKDRRYPTVRYAGQPL